MNEYSNLTGLLDKEVILDHRCTAIRKGVVYLEKGRTAEFLYHNNDEICSIYLIPEEYSVTNNIIGVPSNADINHYSLRVPKCACTTKIDKEGYQKRKEIIDSILAQYTTE